MTSIIIVGSDVADLSKLHARLKDHVIIEKVIVEKPISRFTLVKNRIKRLGVLKVHGQILFSLFIHPFLELIFRKHKTELWRHYFNNIEVIFGHGVNEYTALSKGIYDADNAIIIREPISLLKSKFKHRKKMLALNGVSLNLSDYLRSSAFKPNPICYYRFFVEYYGASLSLPQ